MFFKKIIVTIYMVNKLFTDINMILLLTFIQQVLQHHACPNFL